MFDVKAGLGGDVGHAFLDPRDACVGPVNPADMRATKVTITKRTTVGNAIIVRHFERRQKISRLQSMRRENAIRCEVEEIVVKNC